MAPRCHDPHAGVAVTGSAQLCVFQQWCDPGKGAPTHLHAVEEILTVLEGQAEFWLEDERTNLTKGQSMLVPAGRKHGFRTDRLRIPARAGDAWPAPIFEASFDDQKEVSRRWVPAG